MNNELDLFIGFACTSAKAGTLKSIIFSSPLTGDTLKIRVELRKIGGKIELQAESSMTEGRVKQLNLSISDLSDYIQNTFPAFKRLELYDTAATASLLKSKKGKITLLQKGAFGEGEVAAVKGNNKEKNYILNGCEQFLVYLGISDKNGRVYDKKQSKFRQINRFLENLRDIIKYLPKSGEINVADLCCGKSYLSFAVYYYMTEILNLEINMICVDLKESVMDFCRDIAKKCGFDKMTFLASDIDKFIPEKKPNLVISLHACDTATDIVLDKGARLSADVILSTPCCHRDLSRRLDSRELDFIARHSILKSKLCDAATDALRILKLEAMGYTCTAIELIDPDDTPKNVLIRAVKNHNFDYKKAGENKALDDYKKAYYFLTSKNAPEIL